MCRVGRPPLDYEPVIIGVGDFHLHPVHDADLIIYLQKFPPRKRQAAVKAAMRAGGLAAVEADLKNADDELTEAAGNFL